MWYYPPLTRSDITVVTFSCRCTKVMSSTYYKAIFHHNIFGFFLSSLWNKIFVYLLLSNLAVYNTDTIVSYYTNMRRWYWFCVGKPNHIPYVLNLIIFTYTVFYSMSLTDFSPGLIHLRVYSDTTDTRMVLLHSTVILEQFLHISLFP